MNKEIKKKIGEITNKIVKEINPEKVILFGSYAWGKPGPDSDVDIAVIEQSNLNKRERQIRIRRMLFGSGIAYDILSYTPKEISKRIALGDFFADNIINKGKILYAK